MNMAVLLVTFRESFEGFLLIAIFASLFIKAENKKAVISVFIGAGLAIPASLLFSMVAESIYSSFDGMGQDYLQAGVFLFASALIASVVLMLGQCSSESICDNASKYNDKWGLVGVGFISFIMVFREGAELVLFLGALLLKGGGADSDIYYGLAGLLIALLVSGGVFLLGLKINMALFFKVTSLLLIFLAGGMASAGVAKLIEIDILPAIVYEIWNSNWLLNENHFPGNFLSAFLGYNANPSLLEAIVYLLIVSGLFYGHTIKSRKAS